MRCSSGRPISVDRSAAAEPWTALNESLIARRPLALLALDQAECPMVAVVRDDCLNTC